MVLSGVCRLWMWLLYQTLSNWFLVLLWLNVDVLDIRDILIVLVFLVATVSTVIRSRETGVLLVLLVAIGRH